MKLHIFPWGLFNRRVSIYLAEKGIDDIEQVETFPYLEPEWPPAFLRKLTPAGTLPVLELDNGTVLRQSLSIIEYLEEIHPTPNMAGRTPIERGAVADLTSVIVEATTLFSLWVYKGSPLFATRETPSNEVVQVAASLYGDKLRLIDALITGPFLAGSIVTTADCLAMALLQYIREFYGVGIPTDCPRLRDWYATFLQRPSTPAHAYPDELFNMAYGLPAQTGQERFALD